MSEYYAVQRSDEFLEHYGVRGMKWGVTKAKAEGSSKKMAKTYKKAYKKLDRLNKNADVNHQKLMTQYHKKKAVQSGLASLGLGYLTRGGAGVTENLIRNSPSETIKTGPMHFVHKVYPSKAANIGMAATYLSAVGTAAGLAKTGAHVHEAIASKRRSTVKGHAKAVAKRDAWRKQMSSAFKGTEYASLPKLASKKKRRRSK